MFSFKFSGLIFLASLLSAQSSFALYSPQKALKDAMSEPLSYMGKFIPASSESGLYPDCVFKNSKAIVISSYCVKQNVPAGRLLILPANSSNGYIRLYAEIAGDKDISQAKRNEYLSTMFYSAVVRPQNTPEIGMTFAQIKKWNEEETGDYSSYCVTSKSHQALPNSTFCKNVPATSVAWSKASAKFIDKSDPNFVALLLQIKSQVP